MKFWRSILPNFSIAMNIALMIVIYLDLRNPKMGFLVGAPFVTLIVLCCGCSIACAIVLYASWRKRKSKKHENFEA